MKINTDRASATASSGMGIFGWLIVFGMLGMGPCNSCMKSCGPTINVPQVVNQLVEKK